MSPFPLGLHSDFMPLYAKDSIKNPYTLITCHYWEEQMGSPCYFCLF